MKLVYDKISNFGDALNGIIFPPLLNGLLDEREEEQIFGIGSLLGLKSYVPSDRVEACLVFSTGFAYQVPPEIKHPYEIICVRGPLTAEILNINQDKAIIDGAVLVRDLEIEHDSVRHQCSFLPHHHTEKRSEHWSRICANVGINYISPAKDPLAIIREIKSSRLLLSEALHGAIVADALRVPWIAVKSSPWINNFKWRDWGESLDINYSPLLLPRLYNSDFLLERLKRKSNLPAIVLRLVCWLHTKAQPRVLEPRVGKVLFAAKTLRGQLSSSDLLEHRHRQLRSKLTELKIRVEQLLENRN